MVLRHLKTGQHQQGLQPLLLKAPIKTTQRKGSPETVRHLNYNHLLYFWTVAREGSITKATQSLHLTPQTISGQLKLLEEAVGEPLFNRVGRGLAMTETGHLVYQYADEIFSLGAELAGGTDSRHR
jgi:LysR family transcriptional activator of nhaA